MARNSTRTAKPAKAKRIGEDPLARLFRWVANTFLPEAWARHLLAEFNIKFES